MVEYSRLSIYIIKSTLGFISVTPQTRSAIHFSTSTSMFWVKPLSLHSHYCVIVNWRSSTSAHQPQFQTPVYQNIKAVLGTRVLFDCSVKAAPLPKLRWLDEKERMIESYGRVKVRLFSVLADYNCPNLILLITIVWSVLIGFDQVDIRLGVRWQQPWNRQRPNDRHGQLLLQCQQQIWNSSSY